MLETVWGFPSIARISESNEIVEGLSDRQKRLLLGAMNFHALTAPGSTLTFHGYDGEITHTPRLTDDSTFTGLSRRNRRRTFSVRAESTISKETRVRLETEAIADRLIERSERHIYIPGDDVLAYDPTRPPRTDLVGKVARKVRGTFPLVYDDLRDLELAVRHSRPLRVAAERRPYEKQFDLTHPIEPAPQPPHNAPPAVLLGLHWLEMGGAERWAFETVRLVREAGLLPIVITNIDSQHPWLMRPELDGALVVPFSNPTWLSQTPGVEQFLRGLFRTFDIRGVVVHHNQWLYDRLDWIRASRPRLPIISSTHIVEFRGGGYPYASAIVDEAVTTHHAISPTLGAWLKDVQNIDPKKIVVAPLGGLTANTEDATFRPRTAGEQFTVAFVGRFARQKAPEVFVEMVHRLRKNGHANIRFIMHGDGELAPVVTDHINERGLAEIIERRTSAVPVSETLGEAHVLVVPSHNEGLTLTTLEAISHGVPVLSTDVGAQSDIIPARALVPRFAHTAALNLAKKAALLERDENARRKLWEDERAAELKLLAIPTANEWFTQEVGSW